MSENTTVGPEGPTSSALPVTAHETYKPDESGSGSVTGNGTGPAASKGEASKTGSPVNNGGS